MKRYETKQEKISFILENLNRLRGLEFIDDDEIKALNYTSTILKNKIKELDKKEPIKAIKKQYIDNCPMCSDCDECYRNVVCKNEMINHNE